MAESEIVEETELAPQNAAAQRTPDVQVVAWVNGSKFLIARVLKPQEATIFETKARVMTWAKDHVIGGRVIEDDIDQHFNWFLRYAVREMLEATGHDMDWQQTSFEVDFGSFKTIGNLFLPEIPTSPPNHNKEAGG